MLKSAWVTSMMASPMQRKAGKLFSHLLAILPALNKAPAAGCLFKIYVNHQIVLEFSGGVC